MSTTTTEVYYRKKNNNYNKVTIEVKNGFPEECVCGLYKQKSNSRKTENCVHCDQQELFD